MSLVFVFEENGPIRCVCEKFQDLFRFGAEKPPAGLKFKFNLFRNLFCSTAVGKFAA